MNQRRRTGKALAAAGICLLLLAGAPALQAQQQPADTAQTVTSEGTGRAPYEPATSTRARESALEAAMRDAVEQATGVFITTQSRMRNYELVQDEVLSRSRGYIRSYEVLQEGRENGLYRVDIRAVVVRAPFLRELEDALERLYERVGKPRVLVVVRERHEGTAPAGAAEEPKEEALGVVGREIQKLLIKRGFTFIDPRSVGQRDLLETALQGEEVRRDDVVAAARTSQAEIVMVGRAVTTPRGTYGRFHSVEAQLTVDAVRVDTGQVLASEFLTARGLQLNEGTAAADALRRVAADVTPKLIEQITYIWLKERDRGTRLEIVVQNVSFGQLLAVRQALSTSVGGVQEIQQRSFSDGVGLLEVSARDGAAAVAESLYQTPFEDFRLEVVDITDTRLTVRVRPGAQ